MAMGGLWISIHLNHLFVCILLLNQLNICHGDARKRLLLDNSNAHVSSEGNGSLEQRLLQCESSIQNILQQLGTQTSTISELNHQLQQKMGSVQEFSLLRAEQENEIQSLKSQLVSQVEITQALNQSKLALERQLESLTSTMNANLTHIIKTQQQLQNQLHQQSTPEVATSEPFLNLSYEVKDLGMRISQNWNEINSINRSASDFLHEVQNNSLKIESTNRSIKQFENLLLNLSVDLELTKQLAYTHSSRLQTQQDQISSLISNQQKLNQNCTECNNKVNNALQQDNALDVRLSAQEVETQHHHDTITHLVSYFQADHNILLHLNTTNSPTGGNPTNGGATYIRWGSNNCLNNDNELVYAGFMAGSPVSTTGGSNFLCLSEHPRFHSTYDFFGPLWSLSGKTAIGNTDHILGVHVDRYGSRNTALNCAACRSNNRSSSMMIPGTDTCGASWTLEYAGILMVDKTTSTQYVCIERHASFYNGTFSNTDGQSLAVVFSQTANLPHPPYASNFPVSCVVCSK